MSKNKMFEAKLVSQIKSVNEQDDGDLIIEGYANTVTKDRAGDVIPKTAWETKNAMSNYLKNPIILAFHNHSLPIGKMIDYEVTELGLKIKAKISKGAGNVYDLIKDGILSTFSVGFGILDAEYDSKSDTYYINDVELHEVSVVSVPCNQDSTFSVAKSMESTDFEKFKQNYVPSTSSKEIESMPMSKEELAQLKAELQQDNDAVAKAAAEAARKAIEDAEAAKQAKELAEKQALEAKQEQESKIKTSARQEAEALIKELETRLNEKDGGIADLVKAQNEQIIALKDEIAQVVAERNSGITSVAKAVRGLSQDQNEDVDALVMVSTIKGVDMFDTELGKRHKAAIKAVNGSSSIQVSSEAYETQFSTNLMRDIQAALVVAPLFTEMTMNSAQMTIPINPNRQNANWVSAAALADGADKARTGNELTVGLTERTLKTFKLAAKAYLTEETEEDAIISLVPILRGHLVEAHAAEMDRAFLIGSGTGQPKGLVNQAAGAGKAVATEAKADGTKKVTAAGILAGRRQLGLYGIKLKDIALIISQDAYWDLLEDPEWGDVQQVGDANAVKLNGEVGNIYGMPVIVSNEFEAKAVSKAYAVMVNKTNFVVTRQRGMTMRSDFDVETDRRVFVATQRVNLEPMIEESPGNGKGVAALTYAAA